SIKYLAHRHTRAILPFPRRSPPPRLVSFFFSNPPATPEIYTLSLHDALPILPGKKTGWTAGFGRYQPDHPNSLVNGWCATIAERQKIQKKNLLTYRDDCLLSH